ncbi:hypothetical protein ACWF94_08415 [Streptomyces sp. NPDC055078]
MFAPDIYLWEDIVKFRKSAARATVVGIATLAAFGAGMSTASAGTTQSIRTERAGAYFYDWGDQLRVSDYKKDGLGARAYLTWGSNKASVHANGGVNDSAEKDLNLKEGTTVWLTLCYTDKGEDVQCSAPQKGVA